jgi:HEPN domain-containing protein
VLVPIRTGTLRIGAMRFGFHGPGYTPTPGALGAMRQSAPIDITVTEPPLDGRPAGYRLGDVGRYTLSASVDPKSVRQGEAVQVIAKLEGQGNVPARLDVPQQNGVEWMDPTVIEKLEASDNGLRGSRTFTYVVRLEASGTVDLGELSLPYYDPTEHRYAIARASLGKVEVRPDPNGAKAPSSSGAGEDRLRGLLEPRKQLGSAGTSARFVSDQRGFVLWLLAGPLAVLGGEALVRAGRKTLERLRLQSKTPERRSAEELERARSDAQRGDLRATAAGVERAVHLAIEGATGLKARGVLRRDLASALSQRGLPDDVARELSNLLEATENARFLPASEAQAQDLIVRADNALKALSRGRRR